MRSVIWFYLFWGLVILGIGFILFPRNPEDSTPVVQEELQFKDPIFNGIKDNKNLINEFNQKINHYNIALTAAFLIQDKKIITNQKKFDKIIADSSIDSIVYKGRDLYKKNYHAVSTRDWTNYLMTSKGYEKELKNLTEEVQQKIADNYAYILKNYNSEDPFTEDKITYRVNQFNENIHFSLDSSAWKNGKRHRTHYESTIDELESFKDQLINSEKYIIRDVFGDYKEEKYNKFFPIMIPKKVYLSKGDKFESNIVMMGISRNYAKKSSISVNGQRVSFDKNGVGHFSETTRSYGPKRLKLNANISSSLSESRMSGNTTYEYMVGPSEEELKEYFQYKRRKESEESEQIEKKRLEILKKKNLK